MLALIGEFLQFSREMKIGKAAMNEVLKVFYVFFFPPQYFRLQTGMRGAFGKPQGTVARVNIGQIIFSVRSKDTNKAVVIEVCSL